MKNESKDTATQEMREVFADNLNFYMKKYDIKQDVLMSVTGMSQAAVSDWMNAKKYPKIGNIQKMADYFKIDKSDLIEEKKEGDVDEDIKIIGRDMKEMTKEQRATLKKIARSLFKEE